MSVCLSPPPLSVEDGEHNHYCMCVCSYIPSHMRNGFCLISLEKINVEDSYFIHKYIIYKIGQVRFRLKSTYYNGSYDPLSTKFTQEKWAPFVVF